MQFSRSSDETVQEQEGRPVTTQPRTVVKRRSAWSTFSFFLLLLLLLAGGIIAWLWFQRGDLNNQLSGKSNEVMNAQTTIANLREQLGFKTGEATAAANQPVNDEAHIRTAVTAYNNALAAPLKNITIQLVKLDANQALVSVTDGTSGYKTYLKKANDT